ATDRFAGMWQAWLVARWRAGHRRRLDRRDWRVRHAPKKAALAASALDSLEARRRFPRPHRPARARAAVLRGGARADGVAAVVARTHFSRRARVHRTAWTPPIGTVFRGTRATRHDDG